MTRKPFRPLLLALAIAGTSSIAFAQTTPAPTDNPTGSQSAPTSDPSQPTDTMSPATPPTPMGPATDASTSPATDPSTDPTVPNRASDPAMAPETTTPVVDQTMDEDRDDHDRGFPWGLLGLLGLLGLIPRKAKVVETYTTRDTTTRTGPGYDETRAS